MPVNTVAMPSSFAAVMTSLTEPMRLLCPGTHAAHDALFGDHNRVGLHMLDQAPCTVACDNPAERRHGSASNATRNASVRLSPSATPHGLVCLILAQAGSASSNCVGGNHTGLPPTKGLACGRPSPPCGRGAGGEGLLLRAAAQPDQTRQTRAQRQHTRRLWNHLAAHLHEVIAQRAKSAVCAR